MVAMQLAGTKVIQPFSEAWKGDSEWCLSESQLLMVSRVEGGSFQESVDRFTHLSSSPLLLASVAETLGTQ